MCYVSGMLPRAPSESRHWPTEPSSLPLVLLPGTLCDDRVFVPMLACLRKSLPGLDAHVVELGSCDSVAAAVARVLQHVPEHFALLGFSLGGIVALHVAAASPERVRGIALINSTALPVAESQRDARRVQAAQVHLIGLRAYVEEHLWPTYVAETRLGDVTLRDHLYQMASAIGVEALGRQTESALNRPDAFPLLHSLSMPALVIAGEEDRVCSLTGQQALAAALPNATLAVVPDAGHFAVMEKPDAVAAHVAAWFDTLARH